MLAIQATALLVIVVVLTAMTAAVYLSTPTED